MRNGTLVRRITLAIVAFVIIFLFYENALVHKFQDCVNANIPHGQDGGDKNSKIIIAFGVIKGESLCTVRIIDKHNGFFALLATLAIAAFTVVLARVSEQQAIITRDALELARDEFIATHRPKILVRYVNVSGDARSVDFQAVNAGESRAEIFQFSGFAYMQSTGHAFAPDFSRSEPTIPKEKMVLAPGESALIRVDDGDVDRGPVYDKFWEATAARQFVIGQIEYEGSDGIRRTTGFCREFSLKTGRWEPTESYLEYAY